MKTANLIFKNEQGSTIIVAMLVLVFLTIIGIAATNTSIFESQIVGNEHRYQIDFYVADSGFNHGAMLLENRADPPTGDILDTAISNYSLSQYAGVGYEFTLTKDDDTKAPGHSRGYREFSFSASSIARHAGTQTQEIVSGMSKIYKVGY
jgi:hypothetical protein